MHLSESGDSVPPWLLLQVLAWVLAQTSFNDRLHPVRKNKAFLPPKLLWTEYCIQAREWNQITALPLLLCFSSLRRQSAHAPFSYFLKPHLHPTDYHFYTLDRKVTSSKRSFQFSIRGASLSAHDYCPSFFAWLPTLALMLYVEMNVPLLSEITLLSDA